MGLFKKAIRGGYRLAKKGIKSLWEKDKKLKATFGNEKTLIHPQHKGVSATGTGFFSEAFSRQHVLVYAGTGIGKTSVYLYPSAINVAENGGSMIINNPSGELSNLIPFLESKGYEILTFDPNDPTNSFAYNPLLRVSSLGDCHQVATMLVAKEKERTEFWDQKAIELMALFIFMLLEHYTQYCNLSNLYVLLEELSGNEEVINNLFAEKATPQQWRRYQSLIANSPNTKASIISSCLSHISYIGLNEKLGQVTWTDNIDFTSFRRRKVALFVNVNTMNLQYYATIIGLLFEQIFKELMREIPSENERKVYLLIDEMSSIPLRSLPTIIVNARKYFSILGLLQSESQLYQNFGEFNAKTMLNNATCIYMTGLSEESERLSRLLGEYQYEDEGKVLRTRPLMSASEIRNMPKNKVIILPSGSKPLYCTVRPYYEHRKFKSYLNVRPRRRRQRSASLPPVEYIDLTPFQSSNI